MFLKYENNRLKTVCQKGLRMFIWSLIALILVLIIIKNQMIISKKRIHNNGVMSTIVMITGNNSFLKDCVVELLVKKEYTPFN